MAFLPCPAAINHLTHVLDIHGSCYVILYSRQHTKYCTEIVQNSSKFLRLLRGATVREEWREVGKDKGKGLERQGGKLGPHL